ncbi:unnamed protein product [Durusdinium trenchii]|uniref:EF-hand domain-containing protein n=1 Tax=Durusdinium trenchii TaxID=1381693 RepID=A0ABP0S2E7_9DINO
MSKDVLKSISETIRKDYQEILDERLARWELSKALSLIGVIVERTTAAQQNMSSLQEENIRETKMLMVAQLLEAIDASDEDKSGTINLQEFREVQRKPHAAEIFAALNLPPGFEAKDLFGLLDTDGNGVLDRYEFLLGICRLIWCDDFQSKCLMNHQIAQVREDIRSLRVSISDLSRTKAGRGPRLRVVEKPAGGWLEEVRSHGC